MKRTVFALVVALATALFSGHQAIAREKNGSGNGNGGGGIQKDGKYMTFYSAGFYVEPQPLGLVDVIPGLDQVMFFTSSFPYWSQSEKAELSNALMPKERGVIERRYFRVKKEKFSSEVLERILAEFSRVTGARKDDLELFAITDTFSMANGHNTYLFPAFFQLSKNEQAAILFHEAYWVINRFKAVDYQRTVEAEMAFQAALEEPANKSRALHLLKYYGNRENALPLIAGMDLESGALNGLIDEARGIPFSKILGAEFAGCKNSSSGCFPGMISSNIFRLSQAYPRSLILKRLFERSQFVSGFERAASILATAIDRRQELSKIDDVMFNYDTEFSQGWFDSKVTRRYVNLNSCFLDIRRSATITKNIYEASAPLICENGVNLILTF